MAEKKDKAAEASTAPAKKANTALDAVLSQIKKEFGELSIMRLGGQEHADIPVISTGALSLDLALGVGGLPRGRVVECYGQESSGKTTLALHVVANAQKAGGVAAFIDAEHALDPGYAKKIGVNLDDLLVSQPNSGEEALSICEQLCKSGALDVIVVDSVAALTPQAEIDGNMGDSHMGLQARLMSQAMRKHEPGAREDRRDVRQPRDDARRQGPQVLRELPSPGAAHRRDQGHGRHGDRQPHAREGGEEQGRAAVHRGGVRHPLHLRHLAWEGSILDAALARGVVEKRGSWIAYGTSQLGQGSMATIQYLKDHPDVAAEIVEKVKAAPVVAGLKRK